MFNIMIEIMSIMIRNSEKVMSFQLFDSMLNLSTYADGILMFMGGVENDLQWCVNYSNTSVQHQV